MNYLLARMPCVWTAAKQSARFSSGKDTVVALLGWAGAKDVHLAKYSKLYEERGFNTLRFISDFKGTDSKYLKDKRDVSVLGREFQSILSDPSKSILFHVMSMNGIYTLCSLQLQYPELNILARSRGILFDSCPVAFKWSGIMSYLKVIDFSNAEILSSGNWLDIAKFRVWKAYRALELIKEYSELAIWDQDHQNSAFHFLRDHPDLPPVISLVYSTEDEICPHSEIDDFVSYLKSRGFEPDACRFTDSPHVQHLRSHPEEYNRFVDRYLSNALQPRAAKL